MNFARIWSVNGAGARRMCYTAGRAFRLVGRFLLRENLRIEWH